MKSLLLAALITSFKMIIRVQSFGLEKLVVLEYVGIEYILCRSKNDVILKWFTFGNQFDPILEPISKPLARIQFENGHISEISAWKIGNSWSNMQMGRLFSIQKRTKLWKSTFPSTKLTKFRNWKLHLEARGNSSHRRLRH